MTDTLETACVTGLAVNPKLPQSPGAVIRLPSARHRYDAAGGGLAVADIAVNSIDRSMGLHDLYPFVLGPLAVTKLDVAQQLIRSVSRSAPKSRAAPLPAL